MSPDCHHDHITGADGLGSDGGVIQCWCHWWRLAPSIPPGVAWGVSSTSIEVASVSSASIGSSNISVFSGGEVDQLDVIAIRGGAQGTKAKQLLRSGELSSSPWLFPWLKGWSERGERKWWGYPIINMTTSEIICELQTEGCQKQKQTKHARVIDNRTNKKEKNIR